MRLLLAALAVWLPAAAFAEGEIALVRRAVDETSFRATRR